MQFVKFIVNPSYRNRIRWMCIVSWHPSFVGQEKSSGKSKTRSRSREKSEIRARRVRVSSPEGTDVAKRVQSRCMSEYQSHEMAW